MHFLHWSSAGAFWAEQKKCKGKIAKAMMVGKFKHIPFPYLWLVSTMTYLSLSFMHLAPRSCSTGDSFLEQVVPENSWNVICNARPIREWSENEPVSPQPAAQPRLLLALTTSIFYGKNTTFCAPPIFPNFTKYCTCDEKVTLELHQVLRLPRNFD